MARPQVVDTADELVLWKIAADIQLSQSRVVHKFGCCMVDYLLALYYQQVLNIKPSLRETFLVTTQTKELYWGKIR
jgi:hypothetical protein